MRGKSTQTILLQVARFLPPSSIRRNSGYELRYSHASSWKRTYCHGQKTFSVGLESHMGSPRCSKLLSAMKRVSSFSQVRARVKRRTRWVDIDRNVGSCPLDKIPCAKRQQDFGQNHQRNGKHVLYPPTVPLCLNCGTGCMDKLAQQKGALSSGDMHANFAWAPRRKFYSSGTPSLAVCVPRARG